MFSKTCEYAVRGLVFIAQRTKNGGKVGIKEIAKGINSSEYFIAKILQSLSKKGFVQSAKGPNGGFYFLKSDLERSLAEIIKEIDGDSIFEDCALGLKQCSESSPCPLHYRFKSVRADLKELLDNTKIADLTERLDANLAVLKQ